MMEAHPKEGKHKYKVSHKSSAFGVELTEKNRSTIMVRATTVRVTRRGLPLAEVRQEQGV